VRYEYCNFSWKITSLKMKAVSPEHCLSGSQIMASWYLEFTYMIEFVPQVMRNGGIDRDWNVV